MFILAYAIVLMLIGVPMLVLELAVGQKMQRGSAAALRGISPRLAGVGWAAGFAGFMSCVVYNMLISTSMIYLVNAGSQPWKEGTYQRPASCAKDIPASELYLYRDVAMIYDEDSCTLYKYEETKAQFNGAMFGAVVVTWVLTSLGLVMGPRGIGFVNVVTVTLPFILLIVLVIKFVSLNNDVDGDGINYYLGGKSIVLSNQ